MNTSRYNNKPGVHWWSFLSIDSQNELFLFDSEGFEGFEFFIISDKLLYCFIYSLCLVIMDVNIFDIEVMYL